MGFKIKQRGGWTEVTDLPGFDGFSIRFRTKVVHGKPRATSLRIDAPEGQGLTSQRLATLPLQQLIDAVVKATDFRLQPELRDLIRIINSTDQTGFTDPRAVTTTTEVAAIWLEAYGLGKPPRTTVCKRLGIGERTADNYIRKAREQGLIPADLRPHSGRRAPARPAPATDNGPQKRERK